MNKSLYFEFVHENFPSLVTEIVEKLNEKRQQTLPYFFRDLLDTTYSPDGRWASVLAEYTRVAADVVSLDSELPLKSRDALSTAQGEIPKMGLKMYLSEKQMKDIDAMVAQQRPFPMIARKIFEDTPRVIEAIWERIEDIFLSELSTGVGLSYANNGTGVRVDVGYLDSHKFGVATLWNDVENALPIDDMQKIFDKAVDDQNTITDIWLDDFALTRLYKNKQVRGQYAFDMGVTTNNNTVPTLDFDKAAQVIQTKWGVNIHRVARKIKTEINGKKQNHNPWQEGMVVFTCDTKLGDLVWSDVAEATRRVPNVDYQTADEYILVSKYSLVDPLREFTASQAMVLPVINNVDRIYTLDSKTVQA
jgi:hypothetical protein